MNDALLCKVRSTIEKHGLLKKGDKVLVALSGGADSVFLLSVILLLRETYDLTVYAAHVNHLLRGDDAEKDEQFCKKICAECNIPLFVKRENVAMLAKRAAVSEEVAGRQVRYGFFNELKEKHNLDKIATAHNADDNVETSLYRFIRGSGVKGLSGIPYKNGDIIRPVLDVMRCEIEAFLAEKGISFVTDKTNFEEIYTRNILRLSLIPKIENEINKGFKTSLLSNISLYSECADFLSECEDEAFEKCAAVKKGYIEIDAGILSKKHPFIQKTVIKKALEEIGGAVSYDAVSDCISVLENKKRSVNIHGKINVDFHNGKMFFYKDKAKKFRYENVKNEVKICETGDRIVFTEVREINYNAGKNVFYADGEKLENLTVRSREDGDFFYPSGKEMQKVKLKDYFINNKIPSFLKNNIPVVLSGEDIVWIAGMRSDKRFEANNSTTCILKMEIIHGGD